MIAKAAVACKRFSGRIWTDSNEPILGRSVTAAERRQPATARPPTMSFDALLDLPLANDPDRRRRSGVERCAGRAPEHTGDRKPGTLEHRTQFLRSIEPLSSFVLAVPARPTDDNSLRHPRWRQCERARDRHDRPVALFAIAVAKTSENEAAVHDFQRQSSTRSQHAHGLGHYRFVLDLCFKESEGVHENGGIEACRQKRQSPHVAPDPTSLNAKVGGKALGLRQERGRRVHAHHVRSTLRECERMPPMSATDVNDAGTRGQVEVLPEAPYLSPDLTGWRGQAPALRVAALEVLPSPIRQFPITDERFPTSMRQLRRGLDG